MNTRRPTVAFVTVDMPLDGGSGGQIASWRLLEAYSTFADLHVMALSPPETPVNPAISDVSQRAVTVPIESFFYVAARTRLVAKLIRSQLGGRPYRLSKFDVPEARRVLAAWSRETSYDLLHCDHLSTAAYTSSFPGVPFVLLDHNIEWHLISKVAAVRRTRLERAVLMREARRTRAVETDVAWRSEHIFTLAEDDRRLLIGADRGLSSKVSVWPLPAPRVAPIVREREAREPLTIVTLGSLQSGRRLEGLRWFLSEVWAEVRRACPSARLLIVGRGAPRDLLAMDSRDGIELLGFVEDLDGILRRVDLCVMPLLAGGGIRVKILELVARGISCVGTSLATRGFADLEAVHVADAPAEWVATLREAADCPELFRRRGLASAQVLRKERSALTATDHLRAVVERVASTPARNRDG
jgi:polysaccharide biosynthesis protein PslH